MEFSLNDQNGNYQKIEKYDSEVTGKLERIIRVSYRYWAKTLPRGTAENADTCSQSDAISFTGL